MKQFCIFLLLLALAQASFAQLSGSLSGTLGPGEYHVVDTISVESGDNLTLMPGTTFNFEGPFPFYIYGMLLAEGTETDSIIFTTDIQVNPNRWRGLRFTGSASSGGCLSYCLIQNSSYPNGYGGGIYFSNSSPTFTNCNISNNSAGSEQNVFGHGGGVRCEYSSPTFTNCLFSGNATGERGSGGGVHCWYSSPSFMYSTFIGNTAGRYGGNGGGLDCFYSSPTFSFCTFSSNVASNGGGVACMNSSPSFMNCTISENAVGDGVSFGGGVKSSDSSPRFTNCLISGNSANGGGGVYCIGGQPTFTNCTISDNEAYSAGGGVHIHHYSSVRFTNCTLSGNLADNGGGVKCEGGSGRFTNTIIAFSEGEGVYLYFSGVRFSYCSIFGNTDGAFEGYNIPAELGDLVTTNYNGDSCDTYYNIFLDPMFVDTAAGDYHLLAGSPCIDAGDPELPLDPDSTIADIGAFYFDQLDVVLQTSPVPTAYALHPNWPNPFNPTTTIRYDVKQTGQVRLTIFNLLGREVKTLIDGRHLAGSYAISWNAADLPSGVYFCRMETPGFMQTRKLMLLK